MRVFLRSSLFVTVLNAALACSASYAADATEGTLFGYSVGETYPLTPGTTVLSRSPAPSRLTTVIAADPVTPDDIDRVLLITTPVSHTIVIIGVQQSFPDEAAAREFAGKYLRLFAAKYPDSEADLDVMDRKGRIRFSPDYELVLTLLQGDQAEFADGPWVVEMLYRSREGSPPARRLAARIEADATALTLKEDSRGL